MKKIKHAKDIQYEKMRLRLKQLELEKQMSKNWSNLKETMSFKNLSTGSTATDFTQKPGDGTLLSSVINFGAGYLSRHLSQKAGQQLEQTLQKGAHKLAQKLKVVFQKRK